MNFVTAEDKSDWRPLFQGYAEFYNTAMTDEIADRVWQWLLDLDHGLEGLMVRNQHNNALRITHVWACPALDNPARQ